MAGDWWEYPRYLHEQFLFVAEFQILHLLLRSKANCFGLVREFDTADSLFDLASSYIGPICRFTSPYNKLVGIDSPEGVRSLFLDLLLQSSISVSATTSKAPPISVLLKSMRIYQISVAIVVVVVVLRHTDCPNRNKYK